MVRITAINESQSFIVFTHHGAVRPLATRGMLFWFTIYSVGSGCNAAVLVEPAVKNDGVPSPVLRCGGMM